MRFRRRKFQACRAGAAAPVIGNGETMLHTLRSGARGAVSGIMAGAKARCRLAALGLIPGSQLLVIANPGVGPLLLSVGESRLMVERGIAAKVLVQSV